jgi:hypothetical protein
LRRADALLFGIGEVLKKEGMKMGDIDLLEINEAFDAVVLVGPRARARHGSGQRERRCDHAGPPLAARQSAHHHRAA